MSNRTYRLLLSSNYQESEKVPDFVSEIQSAENLAEDETGKLMLALSEAVTNAIVHGNREDATKNVQAEVAVKPGKIISTVRDEGDGFDPEADTSDPLSEENLLKQSGRGIFLIRQISDKTEFLESGRVVRFTLNRP